jgi:hypothetical protein
MRWLRNHVSVANLMSDRVSVTGLDGALKPHDRLVDPIVVTHRIGLGTSQSPRL